MVYALLIGLVAALALAFGLAFGLGGRDVAAEITRSWYDGTRQVAQQAQTQQRQVTDGGAARPLNQPAPSSVPRSTRPNNPGV